MRPTIALLCAATLLAACSPQPNRGEAPVPGAAAARGMEALGRNADDIVLRNDSGNSVAWGELKGAPRALFFGFTNCPEICPTTIVDLSAAIERLGPLARDLRVDFVSVDPTRDTSSVLATYLESFGPRFAGYTGEEAQVARLAASFRVAYQRVPLDAGGYTMDHSTAVFLLNAKGEVQGIAAYQTPPDELDAKLKEFLR
jgi:protein SCO1/2